MYGTLGCDILEKVFIYIFRCLVFWCISPSLILPDITCILHVCVTWQKEEEKVGLFSISQAWSW